MLQGLGVENQRPSRLDGWCIKLDKLVRLDAVHDRLHVLIDPFLAEPECVVCVSTLVVLGPEEHGIL